MKATLWKTKKNKETNKKWCGESTANKKTFTLHLWLRGKWHTAQSTSDSASEKPKISLPISHSSCDGALPTESSSGSDWNPSTPTVRLRKARSRCCNYAVNYELECEKAVQFLCRTNSDQKRLGEVLIDIVYSILPVFEFIILSRRVHVDPRRQIPFEPSLRTRKRSVQV